MAHSIVSKFKELYRLDPVVVRSPGRVNLIGEHTDYNNGFVLPAAINKEILFALAPNGTNTFNVYSYDLKESASCDLGNVQKSDVQWANYLLGVIDQLQRAGYAIKGFNLVFGGDIPIGAGLSSSAAVECGLAFGLNYLYALNLEKSDLVKIAQKAEHEYAGVMCGIMDQFASMFGKDDCVVKLDCRSLDYQYYELDMHDYRIALLDTQVKHSLASSEYNTRRRECETGVAILQKHHPQVTSLRDATLEILEQHRSEFDPVVYKRCRYVIEENLRVEGACQDLERKDMAAFGQKMYASHHGLQHDYEVSCPELDFLVDLARKSNAVLGARMMGGGFGGCTVNLVKLDQIESYIKQMEEAYEKQFGVKLKAYRAEVVDGSSLVCGISEENRPSMPPSMVPPFNSSTPTESFSLNDHSHRRYNALTGDWILVSPHRSKRPWQGQQETVAKEERPQYEPTCYLCPGNVRANGETNPDYASTFVFTNDFAALQSETPAGSFTKGSLIKAKSESGLCKVVCFSPRHNLTLSELSVPEIRKVVDLWQQEYLELGALDYINYVQIFENKGSVMGSSNPHPHGQIWAQSSVPVEPAKETVQQVQYFKENGRSLLTDYLALELEEKTRLVLVHEHFVALVPFWAVWPFETMIISRRHFQHLGQITDAEKNDLAAIMKKLSEVYDRLFQTAFPYSAGLHQSPTDGQEHPEWHFHMHFYPPLLRSATVKKFMVGYELMGNPQRDITAESAAERMRGLI